MNYLHESESYKALFEHAKQFWTLPASGIAVAVVMLGTSFKELPALIDRFSPAYFYYTRGGSVALFASLLLAIIYFIRSIRLCVNAQYSLILLISESEDLSERRSDAEKQRDKPGEGDCVESDDSENERIRETLNSEVVKNLNKGKKLFNRGALMLIISAALLSGTFIVDFFGLLVALTPETVRASVLAAVLRSKYWFV